MTFACPPGFLLLCLSSDVHKLDTDGCCGASEPVLTSPRRPFLQDKLREKILGADAVARSSSVHLGPRKMRDASRNAEEGKGTSDETGGPQAHAS